MARVEDLYETQDTLRRMGFTDSDIGVIVMNAVLRHKQRDLSILRRPSSEQAERVMKRAFQSSLRSRFYGAKNGARDYSYSRERARDYISSGAFDCFAPGASTIDGLVKAAIIHFGVERAASVVGQAVAEGSFKYHHEKPSGTDGRYKLFVEYNALVSALASKVR